jgi:arginine deiminase
MAKHTSRIHVSSEIGRLRRVIVHRPDEGIARITPRRAGELLFDDIVHLPNMQEEHDVFTDVLKAFMGNENVLETRKLLVEALGSDDDTKQEMIEMIVDYEELPPSYRSLMSDLNNEQLADTLITGHLDAHDTILFDPIPNFIFTRDIAVTINDHILITKAAKQARFRENFLARFIFWAHPIFRNQRDTDRIINMNRPEMFPPSRKGINVSIEGGDVMILNKDYLLIGCSERTNDYTIGLLAEQLLDRGVVKNVVQINIPHDRSYMHIDTIFTQVNSNHITAYKPIVLDGLSSNVEVHRPDGKNTRYPSVKDFIRAEINPRMKFVLSGDGESPYQEREQWTDGCNLVTLRPGVALTYDRNPKTEDAFKDYGYEVIHARELLKQVADGRNTEDIRNTIITLPSNELSRARGGSHCMTCPIERDDI